MQPVSGAVQFRNGGARRAEQVLIGDREAVGRSGTWAAQASPRPFRHPLAFGIVDILRKRSVAIFHRTESAITVVGVLVESVAGHVARRIVDKSREVIVAALGKSCKRGLRVGVDRAGGGSRGREIFAGAVAEAVVGPATGEPSVTMPTGTVGHTPSSLKSLRRYVKNRTRYVTRPISLSPKNSFQPGK